MRTKFLLLLLTFVCIPQNTFADSRKEVLDLLQEVRKAYYRADAIVETITEVLPPSVEGESQTQVTNLAIGKDAGQMSSQGGNYIWNGEALYLTLDSVPDAYIKVKARTFLKGLNEISDVVPKPWSLAFRDSRSYKKWLIALCFNNTNDVENEIVDLITSENQEGVQIISLKSTLGKTVIGTTEVHVTNEKLISKVVNTLVIEDAQDVVINRTAQTTIVDRIPGVLFEQGNRVRIGTFSELLEMAKNNSKNNSGKKDSGKTETTKKDNPAPDFTLQKLDGSGEITLSDLKGKIVVLDFWATWCPPCKKGLPLLNEFDVEHSSDLVVVYAVNVWERGSEKEVLETVKDFWKDNKYKTSVLLGSQYSDLTKNFGVTGIPTTFVIDMNGNIYDKHIGYSENMIEDLKKAVQGAFQSVK
jgi:thiol-disulfide isomerase/thioredoxin